MTCKFLCQAVGSQHSGVEFPCRLFDVGDATRVHDHVATESTLFLQRQLESLAALAFALRPAAHFAAATFALFHGCGHENEALAASEQTRAFGEQGHVEQQYLGGRRFKQRSRERILKRALDPRMQQALEVFQRGFAAGGKDDVSERFPVHPSGSVEDGLSEVFSERLPDARLLEEPGHAVIGVEDPRALSPEGLCDEAFPRGDATEEPEDERPTGGGALHGIHPATLREADVPPC